MILYRSYGIRERSGIKVFITDLISVLFFSLVIIGRFDSLNTYTFFQIFAGIGWLYGAVVLAFIREVSSLKIDLSRTYLNPGQLFILSFLMIIFGGTCLLILPNATHTSISFLDALFTSTSAVCVTGLIVVDTAVSYTHLTLPTIYSV